MAETILGIDLGSSRIKLVQLERSMQGTVIRGSAVIPLIPVVPFAQQTQETKESEEDGVAQPSPYALAARLIAQTVAEKELQSNRIILGISSRKVFVRHLELPFTSSSKISRVLDFELEGMLPVPSGELVSVFTKEGSTSAGGQKILTGSINREELSSIITAFEDEGLNLEVIDLTWHGLLALLGEGAGPLPDPLIIVDAGCSGTEVLLVSQGHLVSHRYMAAGLVSFGHAAGSFTALDEAENSGLKEDISPEMPEPSLTSEDTEQWTAMTASMITQSIMCWQGQHPDGTKPEQIVVCGGGSLVQDFGSALELALHIPVQTLGELKKDCLEAMGEEDISRASLLHNASGLALRGKLSGMGWNFRTGEFAPRTTFKDSRKRIVHAAVCAVLLLGVYVFTLASDVQQKNERLKMFNKRIHSRIAEVLPNVRKGMRPSQYIIILKDRLAVFQGDAAQDDGPVSLSIEILQAVSSLVDTSFKVVLEMLTLDRSKVRMSGEADGFATVEKMKQRLQSSPFFTEAVIKGVKSVGKDGKVQFTLEMERK